MKNFKFGFILTALLFLSYGSFAQDSAASDPPTTEQPAPPDDGTIIEHPLPAWTTVLFAVLAYVGRLLQEKGVIAKIEKGKSIAEDKFMQADELFTDFIGNLQTMDNAKAQDLIKKWNRLKSKPTSAWASGENPEALFYEKHI